MLIERGISLGFRKNILVFDNESKSGVFSKRLLVLMKTVARRNANPWKMNRLIVPSDALGRIMQWLPDKRFVGEDKSDSIMLWGVKIQVSDQLNSDMYYLELFKSLGGALQTSDEELVIGTNGTEFLLGSY
jgi:hypothetical protein